MTLRPPNRPAPKPERSPVGLTVSWVVLAVVAGGLIMNLVVGTVNAPDDSRVHDRRRTIAARLLSAGALDQAAALYAEHLPGDPEAHAAVAYSLGRAYADAGRPGAALRWFIEAEQMGSTEAASGIVAALERLGRGSQARAALSSASALDPAERASGDPVAVRIGEEEFTASQVRRALDDLPPEMARHFEGPQGQRAFLQQFVADALLWQKARRLGLADDPEVLRQVERLSRQAASAAFVEREIVAGITSTPGEQETWYLAHRERYSSDSEAPFAELSAEARAAVARDHRAARLQEALEAVIAQEMTDSAVQVFPEALDPIAGGAP